MNLRNRKRKGGSIETSALNDILFILLFFFLIIATLANPNVIKLANPKAESDSREKQTVVVSIDADQKFYVGTKEVNLTGLKEEVSTQIQLTSNEGQPVIVINSDSTASAASIVAVMRVAKALKARSVLAVGQP